jgi:hypothetical protein
MVLSCWARASLRYRIARTLLMEHLKSQRHRTRIEAQKKIWFGAAPLARCAMKGSLGCRYSPEFLASPAAFLESCRDHWASVPRPVSALSTDFLTAR